MQSAEGEDEKLPPDSDTKYFVEILKMHKQLGEKLVTFYDMCAARRRLQTAFSTSPAPDLARCHTTQVRRWGKRLQLLHSEGRCGLEPVRPAKQAAVTA